VSPRRGERVEVGGAAPQTDLPNARVNQVDGHQSTLPLLVPGLDDQVRERASDRIDDHADQVSADPVTARDLGADRVLGHVAHRGVILSAGQLATESADLPRYLGLNLKPGGHSGGRTARLANGLCFLP
jgi:hypothetical protein